MPPARAESLPAPELPGLAVAPRQGLLRIVDRMLLGELRGPVFAGIGMFAMLTIVTAVLQEALKFQIKYGLGTGVMLKMLVLAAPQFIVLAIPMGVLLGTMLALGRLNNDHEIVALRASGLSLWRILLPPLAIGALLSILTYWGNEFLVPATLTRLTTLKNRVISGQGGQIKRDRAIFPIYQNDEMRWVLLADKMDGEELTGVKLLYFDPINDYNDYFLEARRAQWSGTKWIFYGVRTVKLQETEMREERVIFNAEQAEAPDFSITPKNLGIKAKTTDELTSRELIATIADALKQGDKISSSAIRELRTKLFFKQSIPLTPLLFVLIAFPLAIRSNRTSTGLGFGMALLIVLLYYAGYSTCLRMGTAGVLPPLLAAWLPNAALAAAGIFLVQRRQRQ